VTIASAWLGSAAAGHPASQIAVATIMGRSAVTASFDGNRLAFKLCDVGDESNVRLVALGWSDPESLRWRVSQTRFWTFARVNSGIHRFDNSHRLSLPVFLRGNVQAADTPNEALETIVDMPLFGPLEEFQRPAVKAEMEFAVRRYVDFVPVNPDKVRFFCLHNLDSRIAARRGRFPETGKITLSKDALRVPKWHLDVFELAGGQSHEGKRWIWTDWTYAGRLETAFSEPFWAFATPQNDYFFVTLSGRLFSTQFADLGPRSMRVIWDNDKWPIRAIITDADRDKTYLFVRKSENWKVSYRYFELDREPQPKDVDLEAVKDVKIEGDLGLIVRLARAIGYGSGKK
jgi:hypothetical protein